MSEQKPEGGEVIGEADIWGKDFQAGGSTSVKAQMDSLVLKEQQGVWSGGVRRTVGKKVREAMKRGRS